MQLLQSIFTTLHHRHFKLTSEFTLKSQFFSQSKESTKDMSSPQQINATVAITTMSAPPDFKRFLDLSKHLQRKAFEFAMDPFPPKAVRRMSTVMESYSLVKEFLQRRPMTRRREMCL